MLAGVDWSDVSLVGAVALGAAAGTFVTIRVVRAVSTTMRDEPRRRRRRGPPPSELEE